MPLQRFVAWSADAMAAHVLVGFEPCGWRGSCQCSRPATRRARRAARPAGRRGRGALSGEASSARSRAARRCACRRGPPAATTPRSLSADAGPDGPPGDVDNDGVPNATDLCPNKPDPLQYDEDGDGVGDTCDPCPVSSNNVDDDGDGVGNDLRSEAR